MPSVIYDFGMNNGDDVEYYLLKADRVVAVEANAALCEGVRARFAGAIEEGRLTVLNVALASEESAESVTFYLHKKHHVLSQLPRPDPDRLDEFEPVKVPCRTPAGIVAEYGEPLYIKIDVERFDLAVLQNLFEAGIHPPEISAEAHDVSVFGCLLTNGYRSFNLVDGGGVARLYGTSQIETADGKRHFQFREHSAGPFGKDIATDWQDPNSFFYTLANAGLGWKDIHASSTIDPTPPPTNRAALKHEAVTFVRRALQLWRSGALNQARN